METTDNHCLAGIDVSVKSVKAVYNFKATNNDELSLNRDDIITLTQCPSGGWWEGTLNGNTGWFPANYVEPLSVTDAELNGTDSHYGINALANNTDSDAQQYRQMVFQDIEDTESVYVRDIMETINKYLKPLQLSQILPDNEISPVVRIVEDISAVHRSFLATLNGLNSVSHKELRIGGVFLEFAPQIKSVHLMYCSNHSKFVHSIEKFKKEICNLFISLNPNDSTPGNVQLTSCLSASFRRIDKYPALLQELQRYTDESHVDRGDTQRAGFVFRELSMSCLELRRQKEMELEVMLGNIKNFPEGMNIQSFGEIIRMDSVSIQIIPEYSEMKKDRYLVLFPQILLVLSVSTEMTSFVFEAKLRLEEAVIKISDELVDSTNIFEIISKTSEEKSNSFIIQFPTIEDSNKWLELLQKYILQSQTLRPNAAVVRTDSQRAGSVQRTDSQRSTTVVRTDSQRSTAVHSQSNSDCSIGSNIVVVNPTQVQQLPQQSRSRYWTNRCLLAHPPTRIRPNSSGSNTSADNTDKQLSANEDMLLLQVIESYSRGSGRQTSSSESPQVVVIDESDKQFVENSSLNGLNQRNGETLISDTELSLRDEIRLMKMEMKSLSDAIKSERKSRKKLKALVIELCGIDRRQPTM